MLDNRLAAGSRRFFEYDQERVGRMYFVDLTAVTRSARVQATAQPAAWAARRTCSTPCTS